MTNKPILIQCWPSVVRGPTLNRIEAIFCVAIKLYYRGQYDDVTQFQIIYFVNYGDFIILINCVTNTMDTNSTCLMIFYDLPFQGHIA